MMHVGRGDEASKTEAMFGPGYGRTYDEGNTDRLQVDGDGFIDFCAIFPYLGSKISSDCTDDADIGVAREVGVVPQEKRARHGPNDHVHDVEESHLRVRAREAVRFARDQEFHR